MCGICGVAFADREHPVDEGVLQAMRDTMVHRGPDEAGIFVGDGVGLGHRRLRILDLSSAGRQPMVTPDGRYVICFNGEIYNYQELRADLKSRGVMFHTETDTEVLLQMYAHFGPSMLPRLNGMFAFAILDTRTRTLFLARDRMGIKSLYYSATSKRLAFASEQKAILKGLVTPKFNRSAFAELFLFRFIAGTETSFSGIESLLPGHSLTYCDGELKIARWYHLADDIERQRSRRLRGKRRDEAFVDLFDDAVRLRTQSDVPVGILMSGGLDSTSVAASAARQRLPVDNCFTVGFDEPGFDEGPIALCAARACNMELHRLTVSGAEVAKGLGHATWLHDDPLMHCQDVHLLRLSEYSKNRVTVLLSGEGADELMGGYVRYQPLRLGRWLDFAGSIARLLPNGSLPHPRLDKLVRYLRFGHGDDRQLFNSCQVFAEELSDIYGVQPTALAHRRRLLDEARRLYPGNILRQTMYLDHFSYVTSINQRNDRMTMGASIECRVPFLDHRLVAFCGALPDSALFRARRGKDILRRLAKTRLPQAVTEYRKRGFEVPWNDYLRNQPEFSGLVSELPSSPLFADVTINRDWLATAVADFQAGDDRNGFTIRQLVMLALWWQQRFGGAVNDREIGDGGIADVNVNC